ncbi:MAG TPA: peptidylprolyl isomerase [Patescibacteria group bacterium]|nr:peptidylprolyl isomerase [Patescibacteria group bacterium]
MKLNKKQIIWISTGVVVILILASGLLAYASSLSDPVTKALRKVYPAAIVGGRKIVPVSASDEFVSIVGRLDSTVSKHTAYQTYLTQVKSEVLMRNLGLKLDSDSVSDELNFYTKGASSSLDQFISTYFNNSQQSFVDTVVQPEAVEAKLRIYYNSNFSLNQAAYDKAQNILMQLKSGTDFATLAKTESDDKQTAALGGDMGFFAHGEILPELEKQIVIAREGQVSDILVTRDGYEIVEPIETSTDSSGQKTWHARHILVQTNGFEQWLANQTKNINVVTLKKY